MTAIEHTPTERPIGFGRLKRKEDARFIRGRGRYFDDITLPGMLHMEILRSPYAHARLVSIDTSGRSKVTFGPSTVACSPNKGSPAGSVITRAWPCPS